MNRLLQNLVVAGIVGLGLSGGAMAQHSDVEFSYDSGKIVVEFGSEGRVFEGDFLDFEGGLLSTSDPGFGSEVDEGLGIVPFDIVSIEALGPLVFHDGTGFGPTSAVLTIDGPVGGPLTVGSGTAGGIRAVGQADAAGDFHGHLDYTISAGATTGAYGVSLRLLTDQAGIEASDSFFIVLNNGLDEEIFEAAVGDFAIRAVPEPVTWALAGALGLMMLGLRRRQHRRAA